MGEVGRSTYDGVGEYNLSPQIKLQPPGVSLKSITSVLSEVAPALV